MTCNDKCIHYPVCEQKKFEFANIEECPYYYDNTINTVIPNAWQTEIIEVRKYYAKCPYCEFSFEMQARRELPYFCGACGRRLRGNNDPLEEDAKQASIPSSISPYQMPEDYTKTKFDYLHHDSITRSDTKM